MRFLRQDGKQVLDLAGDLVLTRHERLVTARVKSHGPRRIVNATWIASVHQQPFWRRVRNTLTVLRFIWSEHPPKRAPECFQSRPGVQTYHENCCDDCPVLDDCGANPRGYLE